MPIFTNTTGDAVFDGTLRVNCQNGETLAEKQARADGKGQVLHVLDEAAGTLRPELGESLVSIKKYDVPLEQATTNSLEALWAYSLGNKTAMENGGGFNDVLFFKRAIQLDPNFAIAYSRLGESYAVDGETNLGRECLSKAYALRERTSERERLEIAAAYHVVGSGDLRAAEQNYELWNESYPRDYEPLLSLGFIDITMGQFGRRPGRLRKASGSSPMMFPSMATWHQLVLPLAVRMRLRAQFARPRFESSMILTSMKCHI